jgi:iron(III) transport system ATP-binding protein
MIRISSLTKEFGKEAASVRAVDGVSFDVKEGTLVSLLGPSGCGKTTTLRMIAGLERPTGGRLEIDGVPAYSDVDDVFVPVNRRPIGMVFQSYAIWPHMNVAENVAYPLKVQRPRVRRSEVRSRVLEALELVGLEALGERSATALSGGQQQRVALARALVRRPKILLLDEPLSNLDAELRDRMRDEIKLLQQRLGITTVFVTHDQTEALAISDEILVMNKGLLVESGAPQDVYQRPRSDFAARFMGVSNRFVGVVESVAPGQVTVRIEHGRITGQRQRESAVGERVVAVVRPAGFRLSRERPSPDSWPGTVEYGTYRGDSWDYALCVGSTRVHARTHDLDLRLEPGEHVFAEPRSALTVVLDSTE